jgi:methylated-DNA-[protein]-cysteine S-methyltransferase
MRLHTGYYQSPLGTMQIEASESVLVSVKFLSEEITEKPNQSADSDIIDKAITQLAAYFAGDLKKFELPILFTGSEFQEQVWSEVLKIPYGETATYGQIAERIGARELARAVGTANGDNPLWIVVPCHRVIGSQGELTGYAGGLWRKQWLLEHEGSQQLLPWKITR